MRLSNHAAFEIGQSLAVTHQKESNHWLDHLTMIVSTRDCPHGEANGTPETPVMIVQTALHVVLP
jgi:hypothetical protein